MKSHEIASLVPQALQVSAQQIFHFLGTQNYPQSDDVVFFQQQLLCVIQEGRLQGAHVARFSTLLTQLAQSPAALQDPQLQQHFRGLQAQLAKAISPTVALPSPSSQSRPSAPAPTPLAHSSASGVVPQQARTIGKYQVIKKLGEGGHGIVFLGVNPLTQQSVALKCLAGGKSPELVAAIRDEARVAARINHPNCVKVRDMVVDEKNGAPVIVSDFVDGLNGRDFFELDVLKNFKERRLPPRAALLMLEQMVRGVRAAHKTGIVHRDIKPENFLITKAVIEEMKGIATTAESSKALIEILERRRGEAWIQLSDWGLALEKKGLSLTTSKTFDLGTIPLGKQGGTLVYMPIEQIEGSNIGRKSDVFALGLVLYELLTGAPALAARSFAEDIANDPHMTAQAFLVAVASSNARHSIDPSKDPNLRFLKKQKSLMELLRAMTTRDREQRLSSSGLEAAIQDLLEGRRPRFTEVSGRQRVVERREEAEGGSGQAILFLQGLVIGLVLLLVSLVGFAYFSKSSKNEKDETAGPKVVVKSQGQEREAPQAAQEGKEPRKTASKAKEEAKPLPTPISKDPKREAPPAKLDAFAQFRAKYQSKLKEQKALVIEESTLTEQELKYVIQYSGSRLELPLTSLPPALASTIAQCEAQIIVFSKLRSISKESMECLAPFKKSELRFSMLRTLSQETASAIATLTVEQLVFQSFDVVPGVEIIAELRAGLQRSQNTLIVQWPTRTKEMMKARSKAIDQLVKERLRGKSEFEKEEEGRRKKDEGPLDNLRIWREVEAGNLSHISQLTTLRKGIPGLLLRFSHEKGIKTLDLRGLQELKEPHAQQLSTFRGQLFLSGVRSLNDECARLISNFRGPYLDLTGVPQFSQVALRHLAKTKTILAVSSSSPKLEGLRTLCSGQLQGLLLHRLVSIDRSQARCLASSQLRYLSLGLTDLDPKVISELRDFRGTLEFPALQLLGMKALKGLIRLNAREIRLTGLKKLPPESRRYLDKLPESEKKHFGARVQVPAEFEDAIRRLLK